MSGIDIKLTTLPAASEGTLNQLLEKLYSHVNLDFRHYKISSVSRRVDRRLRATRSESYQQYSEFLDLNPDEYGRLADDLTINVTEFFRDDDPWHILKETVFPDLLSRKIAADDITPLRIWSAGCATGQETYSIAILLNELLSEMPTPLNIEIYGTDIDADCLDAARKGQYNPESFAGMDQMLIDRYFDTQFCIAHPIKEQIHFCRHDLVLDPPLENIDCILCRNVTIYFSRDLQDKLYMNFYHSLQEEGYLFLGKAESPFGELSRKFVPVNSKWKIYQKQ